MTVHLSAPRPAPPAPRPPGGAAQFDGARGHADVESHESTEGLQARLEALAELPVSQHAEIYARLHEELTERLRGTER